MAAVSIPPALHVTAYSLAAGLSVFTISLCLYTLYSEHAAELRRRGPAVRPRRVASVRMRILKPFASFFGLLIGSALARLERRGAGGALPAYATRLRVRLQRTLTGAGSPGGLTGDEMLGVYCTSVLAWTGAGVLVLLLAGLALPVLVGFVIGVLHPFLWLRRIVSRRQNEIRRLMPYALDLLTLSVEAGLDFTEALARMVPKLEGSALAEEFGELLRQIRLGRSRGDALRDMAGRVNMPEMGTFCSSLVQADELGADLGPVLRVLSDQMRNERANRAEKKAMEAPVKILFPLIVFIFPTVFIVLFAPIGIGYLRRLFGY